MPELIVYRDDSGQLMGLGEKGRRAWAKFTRRVGELEPGEMLTFSYRLPRSPQHHRFFFARIAKLVDRQERFDDISPLLEWLKVGAGHCELLPGPDGVPCAIPKSIAWDRLEEQEFIEVHRAITDFLWTPYAQAYLWPHLSEAQRYAMVEELIR